MNERGFSLLELAIAVLILGLAAHLAFRPLLRQADAIVLNGIREEVVALLHRARMEARLHGEARILVRDGSDPELVLADGGDPVRVDLLGRGVHLEVEGARTSAEFRYGPLGTAGFASATLTLRRGRADTRLVISGYGRVRR